MTNEVAGGLDGGLHIFGSDLASRQRLVGVSELLGEFGLLGAAHVVGDAAVADLLGPHEALLVELGDASSQPLLLGGKRCAVLDQLIKQPAPQVAGRQRLELKAGVNLADGFLHRLDGQVRQVAAVAPLASEAEEVRVDAAPPPTSVADAQATAAAGAEDGALQVVLVDALAFAGSVLESEQFLHTGEGLFVGELRVLAFIDVAPVRHQPDVVRAAQQLAELGDAQRRFGVLAGWASRQPHLGQFFEQRADGVVAGGVRLERIRHERATLRVNGDGADFPAVDHGADVEVAGGSHEGRAAMLGLLDRALHDLVGEVGRIELGNRRHDAVQQLAAGRVVDVLGAAHELDAGSLERQVDRHIVGTVAGQAVNLVHDQVVDGVGLDVFEQRLQLGPVSGLG